MGKGLRQLHLEIHPDCNKTADDNTLMLLARNGSEDAFYHLVNRYKHLMINYIYRLVNDYETAVELTQEVFIKLHRSLERYDFNQKFSTWLYKIATNHTIDEIRRRKRRLTFLPLQPLHEKIDSIVDFAPVGFNWPDPEESMLKAETGEQVARAIEQLDPSYRYIFLLKEVEGLPLQEIQKITGIKPGTLKSRLHRARKFLKERLKTYRSGVVQP